MTIDVDKLPPTQYLIVEVLAARRRTGERMWTFPARLKQSLDALKAAGLISFRRSPAPRAFQAWLTDAGEDVALSLSYQVPIPTLAQALDTLPSEDEEYLAWMRKYGLGHGAGIASVISWVRTDLRALITGSNPSPEVDGD